MRLKNLMSEHSGSSTDFPCIADRASGSGTVTRETLLRQLDGYPCVLDSDSDSPQSQSADQSAAAQQGPSDPVVIESSQDALDALVLDKPFEGAEDLCEQMTGDPVAPYE
eukprot:5106824-Lingulodinium_polyedra.AAC.1